MHMNFLYGHHFLVFGGHLHVFAMSFGAFVWFELPGLIAILLLEKRIKYKCIMSWLNRTNIIAQCSILWISSILFCVLGLCLFVSVYFGSNDKLFTPHKK